MSVKPKKHLGQHFIKDDSICQRISDEIKPEGRFNRVLEVGPGMGALTKFLLKRTDFETSVIEVDRESVEYLNQHFPELKDRIFSSDFLHIDPTELIGKEPFAVVGNFPYNISTQILFKVLDFKDYVPEVVGMFQKEVAERIAKGPGSKAYGIISVLLQAFYDIEYLFTVEPEVFVPPPKVKSGVIRLTRNTIKELDCDHKLFIRVVKMSFNQRRKTLRNSLKPFISTKKEVFDNFPDFFTKRPEVLSVADFVWLVQKFQE